MAGDQILLVLRNDLLILTFFRWVMIQALHTSRIKQNEHKQFRKRQYSRFLWEMCGLIKKKKVTIKIFSQENRFEERRRKRILIIIKL